MDINTFNELCLKKFELKIDNKDKIDLNDLEQEVVITHYHPVFKDKKHKYKTKLKYHLFGSFLCPICNYELSSKYGISKLKEIYKDRIIKENVKLSDGVYVDFILDDNKTCVKYFGLEYYKNLEYYNSNSLKILEYFENNNDLDLLLYELNGDDF